jgi:hypothetical protein
MILDKPYDWSTSGDFPAVKWKRCNFVPVITSILDGRGGPHPDVRYVDEIEMFPKKDFEELKKKLDI